MSISPLSGTTWTATSTSAVSGVAASVVPATGFTHDDPRNKFLTDDDRAAIREATGLDVRADGGILSPISMGLNETAAALNVAGQVAADRANGVLTGRLDPVLLDRILQRHGAKRVVHITAFSGVDTRA